LPAKPREKKGIADEIKTARNKSIRTRSKSAVKEAEKVITAGDKAKAAQAVKTAVSTLDRAAVKGIIHPNNAARRKSRLVKKLNKAQAA